MKTILLVDDEKLFLSSLSEGLTKLFPETSIITAKNGQEAIKTLSNQEVILVITDLQMPIMSGFEFLNYLMSNHPGISIVVMTAFGSPEIEDNLSGCGSIIYMEKPIDFQVLAEHVQATIAPTAKGHIKGIDLTNLLQLLYLEHKTCTLTAFSKSRIGYLYFIDGELIDAEFDLFKAENAAYEILKWVKPEIEIESGSSKTIKKINLHLDQILLEAAKKQDEYRRDTGSFSKIALELLPFDIEASLQELENPENDEDLILDNLLSNNDSNSLEVDFHITTGNTSSISEDSILEIDRPLPNSNHQAYLKPSSQSKNNHTSNELDKSYLIASEKIVNDWKKSSIIIEESACSFAKYFLENKTISLQGTDNIQDLSEEITNILDIILQFSGNAPQGSFEYINSSFGLTFIWDLEKKYVIVITDGFTDKNSIIWFRRYKSILERSFLLSSLSWQALIEQ